MIFMRDILFSCNLQVCVRSRSVIALLWWRWCDVTAVYNKPFLTSTNRMSIGWAPHISIISCCSNIPSQLKSILILSPDMSNNAQFEFIYYVVRLTDNNFFRNITLEYFFNSKSARVEIPADISWISSCHKCRLSSLLN